MLCDLYAVPIMENWLCGVADVEFGDIDNFLI